jgi:hypothetical protein
VRTIFFVAALALAGCSGTLQQGETDPKIADAIGRVCMSSGLFKIADGAVATFVPAADLPIILVNAGVDKVCANPAKFAADASTVEWVAQQFAAAIKGK